MPDLPPIPTEAAEALRAEFRADGSRMTMMAARRLGVPEQAVVEALAGHVEHLPMTRLRGEAFEPLMEALPGLGPLRVFVRSRAAVMEVVGTFGGYSRTGPFFNVQTDELDMHLLPEEIGAIFAVEKLGHDSAIVTHSFQFFDRRGDAAFKAFLWQDFPHVPPARIAAFRALARDLAAP